jgi:hypothetical protein
MPTSTSGRLGKRTIPLTKEARTYMTSDADPNDWKNIRRFLASIKSLCMEIQYPR